MSTEERPTVSLPLLLQDLTTPVIAVVGDVKPPVRRGLAAITSSPAESLYSAPEDSSRHTTTVVVAVQDIHELRRAASCLPDLGTADVIACWLVRGMRGVLNLTTRPVWPPLVELMSTSGKECVIRAAFARPVGVRDVLVELSDASAAPRRRAAPWPVLGVSRESPSSWPVAEPNAVVVEDMTDDSVLRAEIPDLVIRQADDHGPIPYREEAETVLGRPVLEVTLEPPPSWEQLGPRGQGHSWAGSGNDGLSLGPLDEALLNPIGFRRVSAQGLSYLTSAADPRSLLLRRGDVERRFSTVTGPTHRDVQFLRPSTGVVLDWQGARGPAEYSRAVAGLAMAGVPLASPHVPDWVDAFLPAELTREIGSPEALHDPLRREEISIRQRRSALGTFSTRAWRAALVARAGVAARDREQVSVLLASRRPQMLESAVSQMQRQEGVDLQILVAAHGFTLSDRDEAALARSGPFPTRTYEVARETPFGDVLNYLAARADGDLLLKVDDDDWYGPAFVQDLVLAREYSAGDIVGCPAEMTYLAEPDITVRRKARTETYHRSVAGGTMLIPRATLHGVGGFRPHRRYVDAGLLRAVNESGGNVYRTHGLGYMLRRSAEGHTWDPGLDYFLQEHRIVERWSGFRATDALAPATALRPPAGDGSSPA